jgi:hypothetical protein
VVRCVVTGAAATTGATVDGEARWKTAAESAIRQLAGVVGAHIRLEGDAIGAVFVHSDGSRDARKIVRDVEAILATQFSIEVDFRKISVAATGPMLPLGGRRRERGERLAFENVRVETSGLETEARVELALGAAHVLGIAAGPATRGSSLELAAEACLRAAVRFVEESVSFALGGLDRVRIGRDLVIVVVVRMIQGRTEKVLTGSSPVDQDDLRTVTYATLDAINRVFGQLTPRQLVEYVLEDDAGRDEQPPDGARAAGPARIAGLHGDALGGE